MQKFARLISLCLLFVFATDSFAKGVDPIRHASSSAEARLVLESLQNRILDKFDRSSVAQKESIFHGLYKMSVKAHNKLSKMDASAIANKLNNLKSDNSQVTSKLSADEEAASEFVADTMNVEANVSANVDGSQVTSILDATGKSLADLGTQIDANGKFKALTKSQLLKNISHLDGDTTGDNWDGLARALIIIIVGFFVLLAIVAVAVVGVSFAAFGVPGAIIGVVVVGVALVILFQR